MKCKNKLQIGDDFGDHFCIFTCSREKGHKGNHREITEWKKVRFVMSWKWKGEVSKK